jgi:hypothetical protein
VAGARGTTLGDAATLAPESGEDEGLRCGGGGGAERPAPLEPGRMPRDDGGGGMRDVGVTLPKGLGTTPTGRGVTRPEAGGTDEGVASAGLVVALESFSSPIEPLAAQPGHRRRDFNPKHRYSRTIS